eukprot:m.210185 g.210185  ORF g.210185 m.210185 type:complete len:143 (+) comp15554_c1_seq1:795-1223(+)
MSIWPASKSSLAYLSITLLFFLSLFLLLIPLHGRLSGSELGQPVDQCIPYLSFFLPANCTKDMLALLLYLFINLLFIDSFFLQGFAQEQQVALDTASSFSVTLIQYSTNLQRQCCKALGLRHECLLHCRSPQAATDKILFES